MTDPIASPTAGPDYGASQPAFPPANSFVTGSASAPDPGQSTWTAPQSSPPVEPVAAPAPVSADPYGQPAAQQQPGYATQPGHPPPPGHAGYPGYQPPRKTNGLEIASIAVSILGILGLVGLIGLIPFIGIVGVVCSGFPALILGTVGAILGHVSRKTIKASGEVSERMALAGIIVGWIAAVIGLLIVAAVVVIIVINANDPTFLNPYASDHD
jgi:hypothetical protein